MKSCLSGSIGEFFSDFTTLPDGSNLIRDDGQKDRILVFGWAKLIQEVLSVKQDFFIDGTFYACPKQFAQLYTIHAKYRSTHHSVCCIPIFYALLPNKQKRTYQRLFHLFNEKFPTWKPESFCLDFEIAVISVLSNLYPDAKLHGCNFHLNQSIWRKVQELGLSVEYKVSTLR